MFPADSNGGSVLGCMVGPVAFHRHRLSFASSLWLTGISMALESGPGSMLFV